MSYYHAQRLLVLPMFVAAVWIFGHIATALENEGLPHVCILGMLVIPLLAAGISLMRLSQYLLVATGLIRYLSRVPASLGEAAGAAPADGGGISSAGVLVTGKQAWDLFEEFYGRKALPGPAVNRLCAAACFRAEVEKTPGIACETLFKIFEDNPYNPDAAVAAVRRYRENV